MPPHTEFEILSNILYFMQLSSSIDRYTSHQIWAPLILCGLHNSFFPIAPTPCGTQLPHMRFIPFIHIIVVVVILSIMQYFRVTAYAGTVNRWALIYVLPLLYLNIRCMIHPSIGQEQEYNTWYKLNYI